MFVKVSLSGNAHCRAGTYQVCRLIGMGQIDASRRSGVHRLYRLGGAGRTPGEIRTHYCSVGESRFSYSLRGLVGLNFWVAKPSEIPLSYHTCTANPRALTFKL